MDTDALGDQLENPKGWNGQDENSGVAGQVRSQFQSLVLRRNAGRALADLLLFKKKDSSGTTMRLRPRPLVI